MTMIPFRRRAPGILRPAQIFGTFTLLMVAACGGAINASASGPLPPVTPDSIDSALASARGGATLVLTAGDYGTLAIANRRFGAKVTLDARAARFTAIVLRDSENVQIIGGKVIGPGGRSYGISVVKSKFITIRDMEISGAHRGIVLNQSQNITVFNNRLVRLISDGIDVAFSQRVRIERNSCRNFAPTPALYDDEGNRLRDGDHPDCIQAWSRPQFAPTADLVIIGNDIAGNLQGIFLGNHVRDGRDDGGYDRVTIVNNRIVAGSPNGIAVYNARGALISGNTITTLPGAVLPNRPSVPVKARLLVVDVTGGRICGNIVRAFPAGPGTGKC